MPSLLEVNADYRARLAENEASAVADMAHAYNVVWEAISGDVNALAQDIASAQARGDEVNPNALYRFERERRLQAQLGDLMTKLTPAIEQRILDEQTAALDLGSDAALDLIRAALGEDAATALELTRLPSEALTDLMGFLADGSPLRASLDNLAPLASQQIVDGFARGMALGIGPRQTAALVRDEFGGNLTAALRYSRTAQLYAVRNSSIRHYQANSDVVEGWIWIASLSPRTCAACLALHGSEHPLDEPMRSHWSCIPAGTVVSGPRVLAGFRRWYTGPCVELTTAGGNRLTCTVNHPILTPQGWIAAGTLVEGSHVISSRLGERPMNTVNPDEDQEPTLIEDVWSALTSASGVVTVDMPTAAIDFHGDGLGSNVHEVRANRLLLDNLNASFVQPARHRVFGGRNLNRADLHPCLSTLDVGLNVPAPTTSSSMGSRRIAPVLLGRALSHVGAVDFSQRAPLNTGRFQPPDDRRSRDSEGVSKAQFGFSGEIAFDQSVNINVDMRPIVAHRDSVLTENAVDHFLGDAISASEFLARYAGLVCLDQVVEIRRFPFSGHVYNLSTTEQWYTANSIITHNCRCSAAPAVIGSRVHIPSAVAWFDGLDANVQTQIIGQAGQRAYAAGAIDLHDLLGQRDDRTLGTVYQRRSLADALGVKRANQYYQQAAD